MDKKDNILRKRQNDDETHDSSKHDKEVKTDSPLCFPINKVCRKRTTSVE